VTRAASPQTENRIGLTIDFEIFTIFLQDVTAGRKIRADFYTGMPDFIHKNKVRNLIFFRKNMILTKIFADSTCITKTEYICSCCERVLLGQKCLKMEPDFYIYFAENSGFVRVYNAP